MRIFKIDVTVAADLSVSQSVDGCFGSDCIGFPARTDVYDMAYQEALRSEMPLL